MTMVNVKEAFEQCEYAFYKEVAVKNEEVTCALYSISTPYASTITVPLLNFDATVHRLSLEIIKVRCHEFQQQQVPIVA